MQLLRKPAVRNAVMIGSLCSASYLGVYFARNILSAVTPQIIESGAAGHEFIGTISSLYFTLYAVGQLINGIIGDRIKARYMISFGLMLAGVCNALFPLAITSPPLVCLTYGMTGFFLSMIWAPITKVVAENTEPIYATRCSLGYTFSSFLGTPLAGFAAAVMVWQSVFYASSIVLLVMGAICFLMFLYFERRGIVRYGQYKQAKDSGGSIRVLLEHRIVKFTLISILTGVVRTAVVFWLPTYLSQYLGFPTDTAALLFTVSSFVISMTTFVAIFLYERLGRSLDLTMLVSFIASAASFLVVFLVKQPVINIAFLILAIMASNCAASMLWSRYCPSLRDTGMVSGVTGFLDFVSYMAAAASTRIFAGAVMVIGWGRLILVWLALMACGVVICLPRRKK
ncbi:MAG: MFS transporter [Clostridia bacterium]|nr:MFS transporter [Clostridia bacterium]